MREEIKYNKVVHFEGNEITFLERIFFDKRGSDNFCGAVGHWILLLSEEECNEHIHLEEPSIYIKEVVDEFLKDKDIKYHKMSFEGGGRIFKEDFNGNVSKELNNEIFIAECLNTM